MRAQAFSIVGLLLAGCGALEGKEDDESACVTSCVGDGLVERAATTKISIEFDESSSPKDYLVVPFVLGNLATINGAAATEQTKAFTAQLSNTVSSSNNAAKSGILPSSAIRTEAGYGHALRTFWNHYDHRRMNLGDSRLLNEIELMQDFLKGHQDRSDSLGLLTQIKKYERMRMATDYRRRNRATTACPDEILRLGSDEPLNENILTKKEHSQGDYCLVIVKDGSLVSEPSLQKIQDSIASSLAAYKLIYKSDFDFERGDYAFKPLVIVIPMDDSEVWPQEAAFKLQGAFIADLTEDHSRPTIYLPADMTKVGVESAQAQTAFHAAIAHEMQHAIMNYFRVWKPEQPLEEVASIDEGIAHFMEDLLGWGELNFNLFPKTYLATTAIAPESALMDQTTTSVSETSRGAAQTLIYYLVSQKGGVEFTGGIVDGEKSKGLAFLRTFVSGTAIGVKGLSEAYESSWIDAVGGYFGSLYVDNADTFAAAKRFSVQEPVPDVIDTAGGQGRSFGMRFNGFAGLPTVKERIAQTTDLRIPALAPLSLEAKFYQPTPLSASSVTKAMTFKIEFTSAQENIGATVVRLK